MITQFLGKRALGAVLDRLDGKIDAGHLRLRLPDGRIRDISGQADGPKGELEIRSYALMGRLLRSGSVGFAEAYMAGECDSPDMRHVLDFTLANARWFDSGAFKSKGLVNLLARLAHGRHDNNRDGAKRNIAYHYDLGNAFYALWLDPSMTYSSAVFDAANSLEAAQAEKYRRLANLVDLKPGMRVLEIGCGWGGFAEFAARTYDVHVTGLTLSGKQLTFAQDRMAKAGLSKQVDLHFCDYRDHTGSNYDALVSIEMFEAVGEKHWHSYFEQMRKALKPGGKAGLQIITIDESQRDSYRASPDFIQKYIFPGGMLPTPRQLRTLSDQFGLRIDVMNAYGQDYARTLDTWLETFRAKWAEIRALGFDERFKRMWEYYLHYCAAGFMDGRIDVQQIGLVRG